MGPEQNDVESHPRVTGLSYKFQRLRERIRKAILSGELAGKLPGERVLAERFGANAKTLSKALTDLAAEGLLERSIGRGTYVRGSAPQANKAGRWLILCPPDRAMDPVVRLIQQGNSNTEISHDVSSMRPSYLSQVTGVVDYYSDVPESFLRDLVVRNITVISAGREPRTYSTHCVMIDNILGTACISRDLMLAGHTRLAAVEQRGSTVIADTIRKTAARFAPAAVVDVCSVEEAASMVQHGVTALVCDSSAGARMAIQQLTSRGIEVPSQVSVAAVCCVDGDYPSTGYFVSPLQMADAIVEMLRETQNKRPATLWLAGSMLDRGTTGMIRGGVPQHQQPSVMKISGLSM